MKIENFIFICIVFLAALHILLELVHIILIKKRKNKIIIEHDYWIGGIIYYNPDDPRIIVPKKIEWLGWTLNFGRPISVIIVAIVLILLIMTAAYSK